MIRMKIEYLENFLFFLCITDKSKAMLGRKSDINFKLFRNIINNLNLRLRKMLYIEIYGCSAMLDKISKISLD